MYMFLWDKKTVGPTYSQEALKRKIHTRLLNLKRIPLLRMSMNSALLETWLEHKSTIIKKYVCIMLILFPRHLSLALVR